MASKAARKEAIRKASEMVRNGSPFVRRATREDKVTPTTGTVTGRFSAAAHVPKVNEIETFSGRYIDLRNPSPASITLEDVAHGLANTCRFNGQCRKFYSVAEHAVAVSERLESQGYGPAVCLAGLHHDDTEAYLTDITTPLKSLLQPTYDELTLNMENAIIEALNLPWTFKMSLDAIKAADVWALRCEAYCLLPSRGAQWSAWGIDTEPLSYIWKPACLPPAEAEGLFLSRHWSLV